MRTLLAIDTSTQACSVALWHHNELTECFEIAPQKHNQVVFGMVESLLARSGVSMSQVDAFAFGRGPGSFTGIRIATSLVQGFAFALDRPVYPISTLAALAWQEAHQVGSTVLAAMDARMSQVYWGLFRMTETGIDALGDEQLSAPNAINSELLPAHTPVIGVGSGWQYADHIALTPSKIDADALPSAKAMAYLAVHSNTTPVSAENAQPVYLRDTVVHT